MVHRTTIRTRPPFIHIVPRSIPTGVRISAQSVVVDIIAVTILRSLFYEQLLTRLHAQIIGRGHLIQRWGEVGGQHGH